MKMYMSRKGAKPFMRSMTDIRQTVVVTNNWIVKEFNDCMTVRQTLAMRPDGVETYYHFSKHHIQHIRTIMAIGGGMEGIDYYIEELVRCHKN